MWLDYWLEADDFGRSTHLLNSFMYGLSPVVSTPFVARSVGKACEVASAAGVAVPVDEVGRASALPLFFFAADFESTFGADPVAGAMVSGRRVAPGQMDGRQRGAGVMKKGPKSW
jgi:hypothetical protein